MVVWQGEQLGLVRRELDGEGARGLLGVGPLKERVATVAVGEGGGVGEEREGVDVIGDRVSGRGEAAAAAAAAAAAVVWVKSEGRDDDLLLNM